MEIKPINYQTDTGFTLFQKNKSQANLEALAEEFESMFINQMLKQARDSKLSDALFSSDEEDNFGEVTTDITDPTKLVNMYVYIVGEELIGENPKYRNY